MIRLYEGMFLLDNQVVREDWKAAKAVVADLLTKHGAKARTLRRWDEKKLAYPMGKAKRATYFLAYFDVETGALPALRRDLELNEKVLRYLILSCEAVPATENELAAAELVDGYQVPPPPADDAPEPREPRRDDREEGDIFVPDLEALADEEV